MALRGQSSGDFKETSGRVMLLHVVTRNSLGILSADAFTQANPTIVTAGANKSAQLTGVTKPGVLGGSVAFTRPDQGAGIHGGPVQVSSAYVAGQKPLGLFINDAAGNAYENTPGVASGRGPYVCGSGTSVAVSLYETKRQIGSSAAITWAAGDKVYASVNGLLTNTHLDSYEYQVASTLSDVTLLGIVKEAPSASSALLVVDLRV